MIEKKLSESVNSELNVSRNKVKEKYGLTVSNAVQLISKKISECPDGGTYLEAGVFNGSMLINIAQFLKNKNKKFNLIGVDTFEGFPLDTIGHKYDDPEYFNVLLDKNLITSDHYTKAIERTSQLKEKEHLEKSYFKEIANLFQIVEDFDNIKLIKTSFNNINSDEIGKVDVLFIDCDLYQSYLDVLNKLYSKVKIGGVVVFDEYYSLKYPGALVAVVEFFETKKGYFEKYITEEGFERVCFIKN